MGKLDSLYELQVGSFIHFNEDCIDGLYKLPTFVDWLEEPHGCVHQVLSIDESEENILVNFECIQGCGAHEITSMYESDYQQWSNIVGFPLFKETSFNEYAARTAHQEVEYDFEEEACAIFRLIRSGKLPHD